MLASRAPDSLQWSRVQLSEKAAVSGMASTKPATFGFEIERQTAFDALRFKLHQPHVLETDLGVAVPL